MPQTTPVSWPNPLARSDAGDEILQHERVWVSDVVELYNIGRRWIFLFETFFYCGEGAMKGRKRETAYAHVQSWFWRVWRSMYSSGGGGRRKRVRGVGGAETSRVQRRGPTLQVFIQTESFCHLRFSSSIFLMKFIHIGENSLISGRGWPDYQYIS